MNKQTELHRLVMKLQVDQLEGISWMLERELVEEENCHRKEEEEEEGVQGEVMEVGRLGLL